MYKGSNTFSKGLELKNCLFDRKVPFLQDRKKYVRLV